MAPEGYAARIERVDKREDVRAARRCQGKIRRDDQPKTHSFAGVRTGFDRVVEDNMVRPSGESARHKSAHIDTPYHRELDGPLHSVTVAHADLTKPAEFKAISREFRLN